MEGIFSLPLYERDWGLHLYCTLDGSRHIQFPRGMCGYVHELLICLLRCHPSPPKQNQLLDRLWFNHILYRLQPCPWTWNPFQSLVLLHMVFLLPSLPVTPPYPSKSNKYLLNGWMGWFVEERAFSELMALSYESPHVWVMLLLGTYPILRMYSPFSSMSL